MRMVDLGNQRGPLHIHIMDTPTSVECGREVRLRRSFRSLVECMVPCCGFQPSESEDSLSSSSNTTTNDQYSYNSHGASSSSSSSFSSFSSSSSSSSSSSTSSTSSSSVLTGTFFGYRKGRVSFCLQDDTRSRPLLLLEFAVPTAYLAREMQHGLLRIALECDRQKQKQQLQPNSKSLFDVPVWSMYCNGRKVGFALRRQLTLNHLNVLKLMQSVSVGAGVLPVAPRNSDDGDLLMYLRASFDRVSGSPDSESFHMINPSGCSGQELSIFFLRS